MVKYIHIGYPKNFSTSLQRDYFSKHPDFLHLGIGVGNNLGYHDSIVEKTLEVYLKTCKYYKYKELENKVKSHFQDLFKEASEKKINAIGVSAEHLGFGFSYDSIDGKEKANRLYDIFGSETKIIMIVRNQFDLIKSLYRESVRVGFSGDFSDFIKLLYKYQDRNYIYDFRYDYVYKVYANLFGENNVGVFFFEKYRDNKGNLVIENDEIKLFKDLNKFLGVSSPKMVLGHHNEAIPSNKILIKAELNSKNPHDLSNHLMESAEKHRIIRYLEEDLQFHEKEVETYSDVIKKRKNINDALKLNKTKDLTYEADSKYISFFREFYEEGNKNLSELLNIKLSDFYFDLKFN